MSETEVAVKWDPAVGNFRECPNPEDSLLPQVTVKQGEYVVLTNPAPKPGGGQLFPEDGKNNTSPSLTIGGTVNIAGPISFALWWQQGAQVIKGHQRSSASLKPVSGRRSYRW